MSSIKAVKREKLILRKRNRGTALPMLFVDQALRLFGLVQTCCSDPYNQGILLLHIHKLFILK